MEPLEKKLKIVERSPFARIARWVLKSSNVAMVLGKTIHLSGVSKENFLRDSAWVAHELCHVRQFQEHGYLRFLWLYLLESARMGYYHNKFEVEARMAGVKEAHLAKTKSGASTGHQG
ncbi:hypothetical protein ACD591_19610 [Rufibacter glacialis]|uniref:DUF4157 domain-containing protein n=1 Tax=Rufibacter glacialis TaxID=1259555 RepID=A0A5M8Q4Z2_9BACT|nr:hypothetical protein [Rufibacter glacialis]KAA6430201.1 hypothetical protein FOE74_20505 [Rufibacter glacialis]GGK87238.1 hypothetical protein GCM10011405_38760 [Rufibacter glacialis]